MTEPDYSRIDGALLLACEDTPAADRLLTVFVHAIEPPSAAQAQQLSALGISLPDRPRRIFTATLSPEDVAQLSHKKWIKSLKLSQRLKALPEDT